MKTQVTWQIGSNVFLFNRGIFKASLENCLAFILKNQDVQYDGWLQVALSSKFLMAVGSCI